MKLLWMLLTAGVICGAQEMESVTLYYTGKMGSFFRNWPIPPATRYRVLKTDPDKLHKLLSENKIRLAVTTVPLQKNGLKTVKFAYQAPILAVHPSNPLRNMSTKQARALLENQRGSWRTFNGPSARIHLYVKARPELPLPVMRNDHAHGRARPRTILEPEPLGGKQADEEPIPTIEYSRPLKIQTESDAKSFSLLFTDPFGIACFDITRFNETRVQLLKIDNIPPTLQNFRAGSYPLTTILYLTYPDSPTPAERELLRYIRSIKFSRSLYLAGFLPEKPVTEK